jgi:hypothetical protein
MKPTTRWLTPDLWPALEDLFVDKGACGGCWCMYWRIGRAYRNRPRNQNKAAFREDHCRNTGHDIISEWWATSALVCGVQQPPAVLRYAILSIGSTGGTGQ